MPKQKQASDATGAAAGTTASASSSSKKFAGKKVKVLPSPADAFQSTPTDVYSLTGRIRQNYLQEDEKGDQIWKKIIVDGGY